MLYGYTNGIYVLDHTSESLPDMDMLQLFASPAGRALVRNTKDERQHRGTSISTFSLNREFTGGATTTATTMERGKHEAGATTGNRHSVPGTELMSSASAPTSPPTRQRRSSTELYKEAVEILGLTCTLSDSCRCIDCQSNYFDYDDEYGEARTELAAGTPILLDHAMTHPLTCSIQ